MKNKMAPGAHPSHSVGNSCGNTSSLDKQKEQACGARTSAESDQGRQVTHFDNLWDTPRYLPTVMCFSVCNLSVHTSEYQLSGAIFTAVDLLSIFFLWVCMLSECVLFYGADCLRVRYAFYHTCQGKVQEDMQKIYTHTHTSKKCCHWAHNTYSQMITGFADIC